MNSKINQAYKALVLNGEELTAKQMASRFNVANPHNLVYCLRNEGYAIYLNERTDSKGRKTQKYRHGNPTRKLIAAGYKAIAAGLV